MRMIVYYACYGMMYDTYEAVRPMAPLIGELRSYFEINWFTGTDLPIHGKEKFLDSGAFSAMKQDQPIDIHKYIAFCQRYGDQLDAYANLDAIPKEPTIEGRAKAAAESLWSQQEMDRHGLAAIPVFHMGEPWEYLEHYIANYDYICLGGFVGTSSEMNMDLFLEDCWTKYLTDGAGRAKVKVHGFGLTVHRHLINYPFYSCDSTTWLRHSQFGMAAIPQKTHDGWDFKKAPTPLTFTEKSSQKQIEGKHFETITSHEQDQVREYLQLFNLTPEEMAGPAYMRMIANIHYWLNVQEVASRSDVHVGAKQFTLL